MRSARNLESGRSSGAPADREGSVNVLDFPRGSRESHPLDKRRKHARPVSRFAALPAPSTRTKFALDQGKAADGVGAGAICDYHRAPTAPSRHPPNSKRHQDTNREHETYSAKPPLDHRRTP